MTVDPTTLATTGATTLVAAMATSAWETVRTGAARLFRLRGRDQQAAIEAQLDGDAAMVEEDEDADGARQDLIGAWTRRLERLLREHAEAQAELTALVEKAREELPAAQQSWVQTNTARDGGQVFAVQGGTLTVDRPSGPRQPSAPGPAEDHRSESR